MLTTVEEMMLDRANATLAKLGLPRIAKSDDVRRKRLMRAIARAAGGPADVLVDALLNGTGVSGKSARAALRTKAEGEAFDLAQTVARIKSAIEDRGTGGFWYCDIDGHRVPVTNHTRQVLGIEPSHKRAYIGKNERVALVVTDARTKSGKRKALLAPIREHVDVPDLAGDDITPRPAVDAFVAEQGRRKAVAEAERKAWEQTQNMARLRARAAAERAAADPNDVARIDPRTMQLIAPPSEAKAQAEADARHARLAAERDAEAAEDARRLKALEDARHAEAMRQHEERRRRGLRY